MIQSHLTAPDLVHCLPFRFNICFLLAVLDTLMPTNTKHTSDAMFGGSNRTMEKLRNLHGKLESPISWDCQVPSQNDCFEDHAAKATLQCQDIECSSISHDLAWQQLMQDVRIPNTTSSILDKSSADCVKSIRDNENVCLQRSCITSKQSSWKDRPINRSKGSHQLASQPGLAARGVKEDVQSARTYKRDSSKGFIPSPAAAKTTHKQASCTKGLAKAMFGAIHGAMGRK